MTSRDERSVALLRATQCRRRWRWTMYRACVLRFAELSNRAQLVRLRAAVLAGLLQYELEPARLRLLQHDFNTTFRLDACDGRKFAVRLSVNRRKPASALIAETSWLEAIAADTALTVPAPVRTRAGAPFVDVPVADLTVRDDEEPVRMIVSTWLPGRDLGEPTPQTVTELGRQMAQLHVHARSWEPPTGAAFPSIDSVLMDSPNRFAGAGPLITDEHGKQLVPADVCETVTAALAVIEPHFAELMGSDAPLVIHGDLHSWNVKWLRGQMSLFDFDDAGIGRAAQDLAIAAYYLPEDGPLRDHLFEGYRTVSRLPPMSDEQFHAALAGRTVLLLNDLVDMTAGTSRDLVAKYSQVAAARLRAYLATGQYRLDVAGGTLD